MPCVNVEPVPDVSQFPVTLKVPEVMDMTPLVPPVIVRLVMLTADVLAVRIPPLPTVIGLSAPALALS